MLARLVRRSRAWMMLGLCVFLAGAEVALGTFLALVTLGAAPAIWISSYMTVSTVLDLMAAVVVRVVGHRRPDHPVLLSASALVMRLMAVRSEEAAVRLADHVKDENEELDASLRISLSTRPALVRQPEVSPLSALPRGISSGLVGLTSTSGWRTTQAERPVSCTLPSLDGADGGCGGSPDRLPGSLDAACLRAAPGCPHRLRRSCSPVRRLSPVGYEPTLGRGVPALTMPAAPAEVNPPSGQPV